jgi:hypothetical protein
MSTFDLNEDESPDENAGPLDDTGILSTRLEQIRDEAWMKPVVTTLLAAMTPHPPVVNGYDVEYCKIKPNRDINLVVRLYLDSGNGSASASHRMSCTVFASAAACRLKFSEDDEHAVPEPVRRRLAAEGFNEPVVVLDDPAMIARLFPVDPLLPGLAFATDEGEMLKLFARSLDPCKLDGHTPGSFSCEILHYKPRRSCALHYSVDLGARDADGQPIPHRMYGKLSRDTRGVRNNAMLTAAWNAAQASGGLWQAARPIDYFPEWRLLLPEAVPGRDFRVVFNELTPDDADEATIELARRRLLDIVAALRSMQSAPLVEGPIKTFQLLHAEQERNLHYLRGAEPALAAEIASIRDGLLELEGASDPAPLVFCHGDFAHGNVLIDGDKVGIIDFDKAGSAEPAFDMAYFLTHLWSFGIRHIKRMPHVTAHRRGMRNAYLAVAPEVSSERLALYEALDFAAYVLRNFRKQSHQAQWMDWAGGQITAARDRLEIAAGRKSVAP